MRRPPRSTRTDTLCPYTTLFRSDARPRPDPRWNLKAHRCARGEQGRAEEADREDDCRGEQLRGHADDIEVARAPREQSGEPGLDERSEERRVGKECVRTVRSRWSADH